MLLKETPNKAKTKFKFPVVRYLVKAFRRTSGVLALISVKCFRASTDMSTELRSQFARKYSWWWAFSRPSFFFYITMSYKANKSIVGKIWGCDNLIEPPDFTNASWSPYSCRRQLNEFIRNLVRIATWTVNPIKSISRVL